MLFLFIFYFSFPKIYSLLQAPTNFRIVDLDQDQLAICQDDDLYSRLSQLNSLHSIKRFALNQSDISIIDLTSNFTSYRRILSDLVSDLKELNLKNNPISQLKIVYHDGYIREYLNLKVSNLEKCFIESIDSNIKTIKVKMLTNNKGTRLFKISFTTQQKIDSSQLDSYLNILLCIFIVVENMLVILLCLIYFRQKKQ